MPVADSGSRGQSPSSSLSSKKEKKKQVKEERDRQKQAEKKKRRLEKALATATAIRIELEQKKQKRKEEEKRLDEEGAALAEAVALQVLGEDDRLTRTVDSDFTERIGLLRPVFSLRKKEMRQHIGIKQQDNNERHSSVVGNGQSDEHSWNMTSILEGRSQLRNAESESDEQSWNRAAVLEGRSQLRNAESYSAESGSSGEVESSVEEEFQETSERARHAEIAAGLAAARAVAALRIAEEARAEAEAAKMAAHLSVGKPWDKRDSSNLDRLLHKCISPPKSAEEERDELKVQVLRMECMLQEKTQTIFQLEQDLEHVKQHLSELIHSLTTNSRYNDASEDSIKREPEISSILVTKSSDDLVDL